jgi:F0F1-type ATP synthase membrane subunit b/b'
MASVLRRFRRLAPPGGAMAGIAPPVDAEAARVAELASIFAALDAVQREADTILDAAHLEADRVRTEAAAGAETTLALARERAAVKRARATEQRLDVSVAECEAQIAGATREASTITNGAGAHADRVAEAVINQLLAYAASEPFSA